MATDQKRAQAGGEYGVNGEWYEGGRFIATTDRPKSAPPERDADDPVVAERRAAEAARAARIDAWLASRRAALASAIAALTANTGCVDAAEWAQRVENHQAGFAASLGRTLFVTGTLSPRQAEYAAKNLMGRRTKRNADDWDRLVALLAEQYGE